MMAAPSASAGNHGNGPQNVKIGDGHQNNNNAQGLQINNSIFHGFGFNYPSIQEAERLGTEKEDCLKSLCYKNIGFRKAEISDAHNNTCNWIFNNNEFKKWYRHNELPTHNGVLWIKGNPGTGKSTLLKHILTYCEKQLNGTHIIAAHFFNARGDRSEQTPLGMLRSLWYQLLEKEHSIYQRFAPSFRMKRRQYKELWDLEWQEPELRDLLLSEIQGGQSKPLLILIDALDECSELHIRNVAEFLERLSIEAVNANRTLKICLSSRHFPQVRIEKHLPLEIKEEAEHNEDIVAYVHDISRYRNEGIQKKIIKNASGIFLWVVLVVTMLNEAYDKGQIDTMQNKLLDVPKDLENMFRTLLVEDNPDKDETIFMLLFVLSARRSVRAEELYFAMLAGTTATKVDPWDQSKITRDDIKRRITNSSRGLIEVRKYGENTVQFIHQSVYDFLVQNKGLQNLDPAFTANTLGISHDRMKSCCLKYMTMDLPWPANDLKKPWELAFSYPFLVYASECIFDHAEEAEGENIRQVEFLQQLLVERATLEKIRLFHNFFEDYNHMKCVRGVGLLHMLAAHGYNRLAKTLLVKGTRTDAQGGPCGTALHVAAAHNRHDMVAILLEKGATLDAQGGIYGSALQAAAAMTNEKIVTKLINWGASVNLRGGIFGNALQAATAERSVEIIKILLKAGANVNAQGGVYGNALQAAAAMQNKEIMEMLLKAGANINAQGGIYGNALQAAVAVQNMKGTGILLEAGANVNTQGAAYGDEIQVTTVEMLLEAGADVNARGGIYGNALQAAAVEGNEKIVKMLLKAGANVNAQGGIYENAVQAAASAYNAGIIKLLLKAGANVNAQGGIYGNTLQAAASESNAEIIKILLRAGANVYDKGGILGSALQAAVVEGKEDIVKALLKRGADINTLGGCLKPELEATILKSRKHTDPEEKCLDNARWRVLIPKTGREVTALLQRRAYPYAHKEVFGSSNKLQILKNLKLSLEERKDADRQMILDAVFWLAVVNHQIHYAAQLADEGANINVQMPGYPSALGIAVVRNEQRAISMLFDKGALIKACHNIESGAKFWIPILDLCSSLAWFGLDAFGYFMR